MKKHRLRIMALVLVMCTIFVSNVTALGYTKNTEYNLLNRKDVEAYIKLADSIEEITFDDYDVKYYYGDNFIVVEEACGYSLLMENGDNIYVNGKLVETSVEKVSRRINSSELYIASDSDWTYMDTDVYRVTIGGMAVGAVGAYIKSKMKDVPITKVEKFVIFVSSYAVNGIVPSLFAASYIIDSYFRIEDPFLATLSWKYDKALYLGPQGDEHRWNVISWTTYNYNTV